MLNQIGSALYLCVAVTCLVAAWAAYGSGRRGRDILVWLAATVFFVFLSVLRLGELETQVQHSLRALMQDEGLYSTRNGIQVLAALMVMAIIAIVWFKLRHQWPAIRFSRSAQYIGLIQACMAGLITLVGLRVVSLHSIDRFLFSGPIHLNWLIDGGLTGLAGLVAILYVLRCRSHKVRR